jgi:hypothetical protein
MWTTLPDDWDPSLENLDSFLRSAEQESDSGDFNLISTVDEIHAWTTEKRPYHSGHMKHSWESLSSEYTRSLSAAGQEIKVLINLPSKKIQETLSKFNLKDPTAMVADLAQLRSYCEKFLELIDDERGLRAAWLDLITASSSKDMTYPAATTIRNVFFSILRRHGFNLRTFGITHQISGILADQWTAIANAEYALSGRESDFSSEDFDQKALSGRPTSERLQLAQDLLAAGDKTQDLTVWLEIIRASTSHMATQVGQVTFYSHPWLSGRLRLPPEQRVILPSGLPEGFDEDSLASWLGEPKPDIVIARVDLEDQRLASAHKDAVSLVELILRVSEDLIDRPGWHLSGAYAIGNPDGHLHRMHGRPGTPGPNEHLGWQNADLNLARLRSAIPERSHVSQGEDLHRTLDSLRAVTASKEIDPSTRLALFIQIIERQNGTTATLSQWDDYVTEYFQDFWIFQKVQNDLYSTALFVADNGTRWVSSENISEFDAARELLQTNSGTGSPVAIHLNDIATAAIKLITSSDGRHVAIKHLKWSSRAVSKTSSKSHINTLRRMYVDRLSQAKRCRNSAVHGGPLQAETCARAANFAETLAIMSLSIQVRSILEGQSLETSIEANRIDSKWRVERLHAGEFDVAMGPYSGPELPS